MKDDTVNRLVDELRQLAHDYPDEPHWDELLSQVRKEMDMSTCRTEPPEPPQPPRPIAERLCTICQAAAAVDDQVMCGDCTAMYRPLSARAVPGLCDCGHPADGAKVYAYRQRGAEQTLCGLRCVVNHFRDKFRLFLGASR